jgi:hypothetical protein
LVALRRFEDHKRPGNPYVLAVDHPAVVEARSLFTKPAGKSSQRVLISGFNSRKIGKTCTKGKWKGFPIYTLTLEERKTCPTNCELWRSCYGNKMHWSRRNQPGLELEQRIGTELQDLQARHPCGFVVRLHVLGDFYSVDYVEKWEAWLDAFPALHVFGYTARRDNDPIGRALREVIRKRWKRFAVRSSGRHLSDSRRFWAPHTKVIHNESEAGNAIVCPAQTYKTDCCGTCGLCWNSKRPIAFLEH